MDITLGYAIALGGVLIVLFLVNQPVKPLKPYFNRALRYLMYPHVIRRHRLLGPWTRADIILQLIYLGINAFCLGFWVDITKAGLRAGTLSLINLIPLFLGQHMSFIADILGISLATFRYLHRSAALMSSGLVIFHILSVITRVAFILRGTKNISGAAVSTSLSFYSSPLTSQAGISLGVIVLLTWLPLRRRFYEVFLKFHQLLAAVVLISILLHVPSTWLPRAYVYTAFGIFLSTSVFEAIHLVTHNGLGVSQNTKRPTTEEVFKYPGEDENSAVHFTIDLKKSLKIEAGQYIIIWRPLGILSFLESHPFVVTSWNGRHQRTLEFLIQPQRGWTRKLHSRAVNVSGHSGGLEKVLFTGPHGAPVPVEDYEYLFMIASGYGIVAHLPLLERLVQGVLAHEVRAVRIRLVWELEDEGASCLYR
jgi:hypothetical protein